MAWKVLDQLSQLNNLVDLSHDKYVIVFKHSTRCPISSVAKMRLEDNWTSSRSEFDLYYLDLISYRDISNQISEQFDVHHESPQIIVIRNGEAIYDVSHLDISINDIEEVMV